MGNTYQPRWPAVLAVAAFAGLMLGIVGAGFAVLIGLLIGEGGEVVGTLPVMGPIVVVVAAFDRAVRLRKRRLTVRDDSLLVERDGVRAILSWRDLAEVRERRLGPVRVSELVFRTSDVQPPLAMDITGWRAARLRRLHPSLYVADWRDSSIGAACPA